eukprot:5556980-Prymnesium_polylepis.1
MGRPEPKATPRTDLVWVRRRAFVTVEREAARGQPRREERLSAYLPRVARRRRRRTGPSKNSRPTTQSPCTSSP